LELAEAAHRQPFIAKAPVVLVCCADIQGYIEGTISSIQDLGRTGSVEDRVVTLILERTEKMKALKAEELAPRVAFNVAIAVEHIVLRALDFGLGTCWVRLIDEQMVRDMFGWDKNIHVVALLPIGFPAESPPPRRRLNMNDIIIR
jgi:nitroreductase